MRCNFSIDFSQSPGSLVETAQKAISRHGGEFSGDESRGQFRLVTPLGAVNGTYTIESSTLQIVVTEKPMLVGCSRIHNELKKYLTKAAV